MFRLFKRKDRPSPLYPLWQRVAAWGERRQRAWADRLNRRTAGWSSGRIRSLLLVFCVAFGSASLFSVVQSVSRPAGGLIIDQVSVPSHVLQPEGHRTPGAATVSSEERQHVQAFRDYLDSLRRDSRGQKTYDSIQLLRPGLLDSLRWLEALYNAR